MKTFLAIAVVLSIVFSLFALNNDISEQSNVDSVRLGKEEQAEYTSANNHSHSGDTDKMSKAKPNSNNIISLSSAYKANKQERKIETETVGQPEQVLTWIDDKETLVDIDAEMGFEKPTEYDQLMFESELSAVQQNTEPSNERIRSIALSKDQVLSTSSPELDGLMIEEDLPVSSMMDQY